MIIPRSLKVFLGASLTACAILLAQSQARSDILSYNFDNVFSGSSPSSAAPWFSATLEDVAPGTVRLNLSALNLGLGEKVTEFYLNLNPDFLASNLQITFEEGTAGVAAPQPLLGLDAFRADGDGLYDIRFQFGQPPTTAFTAGEQLSYLITGISTLRVQDFLHMSMPAGGHGPFFSAIHIQGLNASSINDTGSSSGWASPTDATLVVVPEPSAAMVALVGVAVVALRRSFIRRQA